MARKKGKDGSVAWGADGDEDVIHVKSWTLKHLCDGLEVTDTGSGGKQEIEGGLEHCEFTLQAEWKASNAPFGSTPPDFKGGQTASLILKVDSAGGAVLDCPTAYIESVDLNAPVEGTISYTVTGKTSGAFTLGDGAA